MLPTQFFTRSLPTLPLPSIKDSLRRYLFFLSPLVSPVIHAQATNHAADFVLSKAANEAQADIANHARLVRSKESYISELWLDNYLMTRTPLPIYTTPQLTFRDDISHPWKMRQTARAADLTHATVKFCLELAAEEIPSPIFHTRSISSSHFVQSLASKFLPSSIRSQAFFLLGAYPLDISQFANLFSSTRIPRRIKDELKSHWALWPKAGEIQVSQEKLPPPRHILVLRANQCYTVNVFEKDGTASPPDVLEAHFEAIIADADKLHGSPVAALTSTDRDTWADARVELLLNQVNERSLHLADSALFALSLDDMSPLSLVDVSRSMLVGDGKNRWFDKSFNLVVFSNGKAGLSWEHSWGDGIAILTLFEKLYQSATNETKRPPSSLSTQSRRLPLALYSTPLVTHLDVFRLQWQLSPSSEVSIKNACIAIDTMTSKLSLSVFRSKLLPRTSVKSSGYSPDALLQLSLQLGYSLTHPEQLTSPSTYEAASTSAFFRGRTETIRVASPESFAFVSTFRSLLSISSSEQKRALKIASARHRASSIESASGKGCDRHLFALQSQKSLCSHPLFNNEAWRIWTNIRLSTSTLSSPALEGGGFGPVGPNAYSIGYGSSNEGCHFSIAWWNGREEQVDGEKLKKGVEEALIRINNAVARK